MKSNLLKKTVNVLKIVGAGFLVGVLVLPFVLFSNDRVKRHFNNEVPTPEVLVMTTEANKFPGIVRLVSKDTNKFYCSAVVISETEILTAAHCVVSMPLDMWVESIEVNKETIRVDGFAIGVNIRADLAIIKGDFSKFSKLKYDSSPAADILVNDYDLAGCGFPYAGELVCYKLKNPVKMTDVIGVTGQLYAGMSGGPVVDLKTGTVYALNHAVMSEMVLIAPIVNLKEGIQLIFEPQ